MKKCPTCDKTFEDSMRFCQVDGTPLVDDAPAFDPYATIVSSPANPISAGSSENVETIEPVAEAPNPERAEAPIAEPDDLLDLPAQSDPLKTMYASDAEMRDAMGGEKATDEEPLIEMPAITEAPTPEPPSFIVPEMPTPSFSDPAPPPSPFSMSESVPEEPAHDSAPAFDDPASDAPMFDEPATIIQPQMSTPFDPPPPAPVAEWTPPRAPDASWQNQEVGSGTPFQSVPMEGIGQSKGMAIGSLVCGILSCLCCFSVITGPVAFVLGFIAKKKADEDPTQYGGRGLALGGMIAGGVGFVIGISVIILQVFFGVLNGLMR